MRQPRLNYGWKAKGPKDKQPVSFFVFIPSLHDQWEYDLKITKKGLRQDGMRFKTFKRTIKAGGAEIQVIVVVVYEPELQGA